MKKDLPLTDLLLTITKRSICKIQVGAIIVDSSSRIIAWGWNHSGSTGNGCHAEISAIKRANRSRLLGSTIMVIGIRRNRIICSFPCPNCYRNIVAARIKFIECYDRDRKWQRYVI